MPRRAPAPRSSSDSESSWPPRTSFWRKWAVRRPKGLCCHCCHDVCSDCIRIHLFRELHEAVLETESAEAVVHLLHGPGGDDRALFQHREVGAETVGLFEDG